MIGFLVMLSVLYGSAVVMACLELAIEHDHPLRGLFWHALFMPLDWLWWLSVRTGEFFLPPAKPRKTRSDLERRIRELEDELGVGHGE